MSECESIPNLFTQSTLLILRLVGTTLLDHPKKNTRKEACWAISNITAGTPGQIQAIIDAGVVPKLVEMLHGSDFDIQKEVAWAFRYLT